MTVKFEGSFKVTPILSIGHATYLRSFSRTRHMLRDAEKAEKLTDVLRAEVHLPIGDDGEYYVGSSDQKEIQHANSSILDVNKHPRSQPSLWCDWEPNREGTEIVWNGQEKARCYVEWLAYLINNFMQRWGYVLNGSVSFRDVDDETGIIVVKDNVVTLRYG